MLVPNQYVEVHWCPANKQHYEERGYKFTKYRDTLQIRAEDLLPTSTIKVRVICDYCNHEYITAYKNYYKGLKTYNNNACKNCHFEKSKETNLRKYGSENVFGSKEIQQKIKETNLERYGVENVGQNEDIKEKICATNFERYGVSAPIQNIAIQEKTKQTNLERYGVENIFQSPECQQKIKNFWLETYGVENIAQAQETIEKVKQTNLAKRGVTCSFQDPEVMAKCRKSLAVNGTINTSKAERKMCETLMELYGPTKCFPSYPFGKITLDCFLDLGENKIDVEYDGWYWHKNSQEQDKRRNYYVSRRGIKVLRFRANKRIPTKDELKQAIEELVKSSSSWKIVDLDV